MSSNGKFVGFMDIGTNSVRLLVVRINQNNSYTIVSEEKEMVRLGAEEFKDNFLKREAINRTVSICRKFAELAKTYGASDVVAVGTAAVREARNQSEFLLKLAKEAGVNAHVILGKEEARLIYLGVSSGVEIGEEKAVFIDLGGGSTEITIGNQFKCFYLDSLKVGAVRLTNMFIGEKYSGPVSRKKYERTKRYVSSCMPRTTEKVRESGAKLVLGSSGTIINLAEITNKLFKETENGKNLVLTRKNLKKLVPVLCSAPLGERKKIPGMNPERADIMVAGAAITEALMEEFDIEQLTTSQRGLRDGLLVDYLSQSEGFRDFQKTPVRQRTVLQLGRSCSFDEKHGEVVASLAMQLFDSSKKIGLHDLKEDERELLRYAATLHDVGDFLSFTDHQLHSHYIISNAELLGFDQKEISIIANIARFHRKKLPTKKALKSIKLDDRDKKTVVVLSTFLRLAEKLDRSHCGLVKKAEFSQAGKNHVLLTISSLKDCSLEEWSIAQNASAFSLAFQKRLDASCVRSPFES